MDFYKTIEDAGLLNLLQKVKYETPTYLGWPAVRDYLADIVKNNKSAFLIGDCDVDGLMCILGMRDGLRALGAKNIGVYRYKRRTHNVDRVAITQCIQGHYDYCIVMDAGSNDYGILKDLVNRGIRVILLDHHNTSMSYEDYGEGFAVINTMIENRTNDIFRLSAGALCFTVIDLLAQYLGRETPIVYSAYAVVSLFADVMDMSNELNRGLYFLAKSILEEKLPAPVTYFLNNYNRFNARYIGFWYAPKINACFRTENLELINELFLDDLDVVEKSSKVKQIQIVWENARELTNSVSDIITVNQWDNFVIADLASVNKYINVCGNKLWNFTGLVANQLSDRFSKTAVVFCQIEDRFKGSVRDLYGRNYLTLFKQICFAEGHNAAFGIKLNPLDYESFISGLRVVDQKYAIQGIENAPIIIDWPYQSPDVAMLEDMARINEFAGPNVQQVLLRKQIVGAMKVVPSKYYYKLNWDGVDCTSKTKLQFGQYVLFKPYNSWKLKLSAQS